MKKLLFLFAFMLSIQVNACFQRLELDEVNSLRGFLMYDKELKSYVIDPTGAVGMEEKRIIGHVIVVTNKDLMNLVGRSIAVSGIVSLKDDQVYIAYESHKL